MIDRVTELCLRAVQATLEDCYPTIKHALTDPTDAIDAKVLENWTAIQLALGRRLDGLALTQEQRDFATDWLASWLDYGPDEARAQLDAWIDWVGIEEEPDALPEAEAGDQPAQATDDWDVVF